VAFFFQLSQPHIESNQIDYDAGENGRDYCHHDPDFTIGPKPVSHLDAVGDGLLRQ
jgi:hypothetical protein